MNNIAVSIFIIALMTFITRLIPFVVFKENKLRNQYVEFLGKYLPPSVMIMLVIYSIKHINLFSGSRGIPEFLGILVVVTLHVWKRNTLLSISLGTVTYMLLIQYIFN